MDTRWYARASLGLFLLVLEEGNEVPFVEAQLDLRPGDGVQIVGLKLKDGTVVATLAF